jgi:hypothetical protein
MTNHNNQSDIAEKELEHLHELGNDLEQDLSQGREHLHEIEHGLEQEREHVREVEHELEEVHELEHEVEHRKPEQNNEIDLYFIINGVETKVEANVHEPLKAARNKALEKSNNIARPADDWQVTTEAGDLLDPEKKIVELGLQDGVHLLLTLAVGAGGC